MSIENAWDYLEGNGIADYETLQLVTSGWGYTMETLETVLYVRTGFRSFEQLNDDEDK